MSVMNIPNSLTVFRIILIPAFVVMLEYGRYDIALGAITLASLTDALDGYIARVKNQRTELGAFLDPLADKFMLVTSFILYAYYGWVPEWVTIVIISRDVVVVTGWVLLYVVRRSLTVEVSLLGKMAIFMQFTTVFYVLLDINFGIVPEAKIFLVTLTAAITVISGVQYVLRGLRS